MKKSSSNKHIKFKAFFLHETNEKKKAKDI